MRGQERRRREESQSRSSRENRRGCRTRCEGLRCKSAPHPHTAQPNRERHTHAHTHSAGISSVPSAAERYRIRLTAARRQKRRRRTIALLLAHFICAGFRANMMSMNSKQHHFAMHPSLPEHKYTTLHSSSEAIRRACLQTPQVNELQNFCVSPPAFFSCAREEERWRRIHRLNVFFMYSTAIICTPVIFSEGMLTEGSGFSLFCINFYDWKPLKRNILCVMCVDTIPQLTSPLSFSFSVFPSRLSDSKSSRATSSPVWMRRSWPAPKLWRPWTSRCPRVRVTRSSPTPRTTR